MLSALLEQIQKGKLWDFHGGIHPDEHKDLSSHQPLVQLGLPPLLVLPLRITSYNVCYTKLLRHLLHTGCLATVHLVSALELGHGHVPHVFVVDAPQQVPEDAFTHA